MTDSGHTTQHEVLRSLRHFAGIIQFIDAKFDFTTSDGKTVLEEAKKAHALLEAYLDRDGSHIEN